VSSAARNLMPRRGRTVRMAMPITRRRRAAAPSSSGSAFPRQEFRRGTTSIPAACEDVP
jgi:hypothetical protein